MIIGGAAEFHHHSSYVWESALGGSTCLPLVYYSLRKEGGREGGKWCSHWRALRWRTIVPHMSVNQSLGGGVGIFVVYYYMKKRGGGREGETLKMWV
jgi:hypothetical protein